MFVVPPTLVEIQRLLLDATPENITATCTSITQSSCINSPGFIKDLAAAFRVAASIRPAQIPTLANIFLMLVQTRDSFDTLATVTLNALVDSFANPIPFPAESSSLSFLYECFRLGAFAMSEIVQFFKRLKKAADLIRALCWLYAYLGPEIQHAHPRLSRSIAKKLRQPNPQRPFPSIFKHFIETLPQLLDSQWSCQQSRRNFFSHESTLLSRIRSDDVDGLVEASTHPQFNFDQRISPMLYCPSAMLQSRPTLIQVAALFGAVKCFKFLLMNGASLAHHDHNGLSVAQFAVAGGNLEIIRLCQQHSVDFFGTLQIAIQFQRNDIFDWFMESYHGDCSSVFDADGRTGLHAACESNNLYALARCLAAGADPNHSSFCGWTPLRIAVRRGHIDCVRLLFGQSDLDPNPRTNSLVTPLHLAAKHGHLDIAKFLVEHGADVNAMSQYRCSPLSFAVGHRHVDLVKYLLSLPDVDINVVSIDQSSPLTTSIAMDQTDIMELLLADPRIVFDEFQGALYQAAKFTKLDLFRRFMARPDIDVSLRGVHGETLLHHLAQDSHVEFLRLFIAHPDADVNAVDGAGCSALHQAAATGSALAVRVLLDHKSIDVNVRNAVGNNALNLACASGAVDVIMPLLMRREMDVNCVGGNHLAPIHSIVMHGLIDCLRAICWRTDLDVNALTQTPKHCTALMMVASSGREDMMRVLLAHPDIDKDVMTGKARQALRLAKRRGHIECARLMWKARPKQQAAVPQSATLNKNLGHRATLSNRLRPRLVM
jgi:ankyrin repeat protein